jgi:hypothetical protein
MSTVVEPDYVEEVEAEPVYDLSETKRIIALIRGYITEYFRGKKHALVDLHQMKFVKLVINSSVCNSTQMVYDCISIEYAHKKLHRYDYVDKLLKMHLQTAKLGIPKEFATGLILMEYALCKGIDVLDDEEE